MKLLIVLLVFHHLLQLSNAYRILGVFTFASYSHYALGSRLMKELAERGHDVTIITPFLEKNPPKYYKEIYLEGLAEEAEKRREDMAQYVDMNPKVMLLLMNFFVAELAGAPLENPKVKALINNPNEKFDLVIVEEFMNDAHKVFAHHFEAPLVVFSSVGSGHFVNTLVGNPAPRSFVADLFTSYTGNMNFWQRMDNLFIGVLEQIVDYLLFMPTMNRITQEFYPGAPSVEEMNHNASLVLLNSHPSINQPVPHVPSMIEIGGFHVHPPKPLPKDLKEYLDNAKEGVVYFSMGSNLKSKYLPGEKREAILKVFSKLKQKVLWKFEEESLPGKPENVRISAWLPQQDILAHPNVKVFITHGGLLSTIEAIYHGVPVVGIPTFADQKMNMANSVANGFGVLVNYADLSEESLGGALIEVLNNPKYKENAKTRSRIMQDQPVKPMDNAIFWTEYVVRHKGAPHLRSAALDLYWYQYYMLDVIAFIVVTQLVTSYLAWRGLRAILSRRKKTQKLQSANLSKKRN